MTECKNTDWVPIVSLHFEQVTSASELNFGHVAILKSVCSAAVPSFPCSNIISHSCNLRGNVCNKFCATLLFFAVSIVCLHSSSRMQLHRCILPPSYSYLQGPSDLPRNDTPSPMIDTVDWKIGTKLRPHCQRVQVFIVCNTIY